MARLDDLVAQVSDPRLRQELAAALKDLKQRQRFGLVFEEHQPETTALYGLPIQVGSLVQRRDDTAAKTPYRVVSLDGDQATVEPVDGGGSETLPTSALLVVKRFGEPMYPALTPLGSVRRGPVDKPHHAVINGENYHALQLLLYLYEGQVDCIYIDPPYNTGARDWKYNNRYVDEADSWRHSKWLSHMEKRLRLAKRLLKADGVLIVTIDEHELHHLGMLLERLLPEYLRHLVTIVINPKGTAATNFARVDEYAIFVTPPDGERIEPVSFEFGLPTPPKKDSRRLRLPLEDETGDDGEAVAEGGQFVRKLALRRDGAESSNRRDRPRQFYAIYIDEEMQLVTGIGPELALDEQFDNERLGGWLPVYPLDPHGRHRVWRYGRATMTDLIEKGQIQLGKYNEERDTYALYHVKPITAQEAQSRRPRTVWWHPSHDAGAHGSSLLNMMLQDRSAFPFPKSLYAVRDCLSLVVNNRPNALILDFFAGSGTTLHATCLLNAADGGRRRCVLVTNNEVGEEATKKLHRQGVYRGDPQFERHGVFEAVTVPRCKSAVLGTHPDGTPFPPDKNYAYLDGRAMCGGLSENVEFFRVDYLDPDEVDLGLQFAAVLPSLWLAAGGVGEWEAPGAGADFNLPAGSTYGVLFRESRFGQFLTALEQRPDVTHVWLVTDSEEAFAEMRSQLPPRLRVSMLYRDYLRNFRINTERNL